MEVEKRACVVCLSVKSLELVAERMPPADPVAFRCECESRKCGRIDLNLMLSRVASFVSWSRAIDGLFWTSSERTSMHLAWSPSPLTFQDMIE